MAERLQRAKKGALVVAALAMTGIAAWRGTEDYNSWQAGHKNDKIAEAQSAHGEYGNASDTVDKAVAAYDDSVNETWETGAAVIGAILLGLGASWIKIPYPQTNYSAETQELAGTAVSFDKSAPFTANYGEFHDPQFYE